MNRNKFSTESMQVAYLFDVVERPIENSRQCPLKLLRLIFDVVRVDAARKIFASYGQCASRDLIIGNGSGNQQDSNILAYAQALSLNQPQISSPQAWLELKNSIRWVKIQFGEPREPDLRQPFESFHAYQKPAGWELEKDADFYPGKEWVSVNQASRFFRISDSTIRRRVAALEPQYGKRLVTTTNGGHRRINLECLRLLLTS